MICILILYVCNCGRGGNFTLAPQPLILYLDLLPPYLESDQSMDPNLGFV